MPTTHDELERILAGGLWRELVPYVEAPAESTTGREVRRWYRARRAHWTRTHEFSSPREDSDPAACVRMLAIALSSPDDAVSRIAKTSWSWTSEAADAGMVAAASARGSEWCAEFVGTFASVQLQVNGELDRSGWFARLCLALVAHGDLDRLPRNDFYGRSWAAHHARAGITPREREYLVSRGVDPGPEPTPGSRLLPMLRSSPLLQPSVECVLATPGAIGMLENGAEPGGELAPAVAVLIEEALLDRDALLEDALVALTRQDTPATQKGLAKLLGVIEPTPAEARARMPLLLGLVATCRGPVGAVLLPVLIEAAGDAEIVELATTVFSRPERAQQDRLLRALTASDARERWGDDALAAALKPAASTSHAATANRAAAALDRLGRAPAPAPAAHDGVLAALWADPPAVDGPPLATVIDPSERALTAALSRLRVHRSPADPAMFWDALVRAGFRDAPGVRRWAQHYTPLRLGDPGDELAWAARPALKAASAPCTPEKLLAMQEAAVGARTGRFVNGRYLDADSLPGVIGELLAAEVSTRFGTIPFLVSTPTSDDGTLALSALVERLREYGRTPVGRFDLLVALLRLAPVDPAHAAELDTCAAVLWDPAAPGARWLWRTRGPRVAPIVRRWVEGGGLPPLPVRHTASVLALDPVALPLDLGDFPGFPTALVTGYSWPDDGEMHRWDLDVEHDFGVIPAWIDHAAATMQRHFDQAGRPAPPWLPLMARTPRPGLAVQHAVAETLSHEDTEHRLAAVDAALTMMGRRLWNSDAYTGCCLHLLADGRLPLARTAHAWEQLILAGGMRPLWPTVLAVLDATASLPRTPSGLSELLGMLRRYLRAVPDPDIPASIEHLAATRATTKAGIEARALLDAIGGGAR